MSLKLSFCARCWVGMGATCTLFSYAFTRNTYIFDHVNIDYILRIQYAI